MIIKNGKTITSVIKGSQTISKIIKGTLTVYEAFKKLVASGVPSLTLSNSISGYLLDYKIYGESVQNGTPTVDEPIEVESVGEYDETSGKYKIPVKVSGVQLFNNALPYKDLDALITDIDDLKAGIKAGQMIFYGVLFSSTIGTQVQCNRSNVSFVVIPIENNKTYVLNGYSKQRLLLIDENFTTVEVGKKTTNITNTINAKYIGIYTHNKAQSSSQQTWTLDDVLANLMVNEGETSLDYVPYVTPITTNIYLKEPLRSLMYKTDPIATDYIDFENQKVVREVKKKTFDSSISLDMYDDIQENVLGFYGNVFSDGSGYIRTTILSNKLIRSEADIAPRAVLSVNYETFYATASALKVTISKERVSDKETLKAWFDANELYFVYPLLTPTEETIELPNIPTIKGTTILSIDTIIQPSNLEVVYKGK